MQLWTWKTAQAHSFLTCDLIPMAHGFFTQHSYPLGPEDLVAAIANRDSPPVAVYRVQQVHSGDVLRTTEIERVALAGLPQLEDGSLAPFPLADGIVTKQPGQSVWTCSADCTPALVTDVKTGQVAAVHAGWRGTAQKILPAAVSKMRADGSALADLRVALGPAIDGSVYQVKRAVAAEVGATVLPADQAFSEDEAIAHLLSIETPPLLNDPDEGRVRLDVRRINQMQLVQMGLDEECIAIAPHCTYQEPENFFSYRRTQEKKVQWAGIIST
ncbi:MAG: peptidoglycan editing factor PgeF [Leptolyngbya foveolarum]|uniref:Purine nucleoside phosphorylase n=1 Tax=Leptolyngbya foveolarum TaxID=47253 RepID=A0A2W4UWP1_9CYAN|nr:MAG: peptidoglycan editing factor PgeF [Leptolyngbya foveolarum]